MSTNKERKINIIDLIFVAVLVVVILFAVFKFANPGTGKVTNATKVTYTLEIANAFPELTSYIEEGDKVFDDESMKEIGEVSEIRKKNATILAQNSDKGTLEVAQINDKINVEIEVTADGAVTSGNVSVNSVNLLIGKTVECIVGDAYVNAVIVDVVYEDAVETKEALSE